MSGKTKRLIERGTYPPAFLAQPLDRQSSHMNALLNHTVRAVAAAATPCATLTDWQLRPETKPLATVVITLLARLLRRRKCSVSNGCTMSANIKRAVDWKRYLYVF